MYRGPLQRLCGGILPPRKDNQMQKKTQFVRFMALRFWVWGFRLQGLCAAIVVTDPQEGGFVEEHEGI